MDAVYLWDESAASPTHVIALQIFRPREDAGADLPAELYAEMTDPTTLKSAFRRRPYRSLRTGGQYAWSYDDDVDLELHVRRVGLPRLVLQRQLCECVAASAVVAVAGLVLSSSSPGGPVPDVLDCVGVS
jgi:hypothetical protein